MPLPFARSASQTRPTFSRDFAGLKTLDHGVGPAIKFERASNATFFDANGTLRFAPSNAIRNSQAVGAVVGSPGTRPTNWEFNTISGITYEIAGTSTVSGLSCVDVRVYGTNTSGSLGYLIIRFDPPNHVTASSGQVWTGSFYAALVGGGVSGITNGPRIMLQGGTAAGAFVESSQTSLSLTSSIQRFSQSRTLTGATTERANVQFYGEVANGAAIDLTLRIAAPQLERNATASEYIPTTGTANFDQPRFDHDPATGASRGLLIEESRTNSIRNSQAGGSTNGVIGSGGVMPTNWISGSALGVNGLTVEVVGTGTENGLSYFDVKVSGTPTGNGDGVFAGEAATVVSGNNTQTWTHSMYVKLEAGSLTNISSVQCSVQERSAANAVLNTTDVNFTPTSQSLRSQRISATRALSNASTAFVYGFIRINYTSANPIDLTLRIAAPQLEQGAFPTSYIPTTTAAATRSADSAVVTPISGFYNASEGTLFAEFSRNQVVAQGRFLSFTNAADIFLNFLNLETGYSNPAIHRIISTNGTSVASGPAAGNVVGTIYRLSGGYSSTSVIAAQNGVLETQAAVTGTPTGIDSMAIGATRSTTTVDRQLNGHIRKIAYYPRRLSNTLLQQLTT